MGGFLSARFSSRQFSARATRAVLLSLLGAATVLVASQASAATGDWTQYGFTAAGRRENTQETILTKTTVSHLAQKWSANIPIGGSGAAVANGIVYVGSTDNNLYAFDARSGAPVWHAETGGPIQSSPAVAGGAVYVGSSDGSIYAFDAETGAKRWSVSGASYPEQVAVAHDLVYASSGYGGAMAINIKTGRIKWQASNLWYDVTGQPVIAHGIAYFSFQSGEIAALNARTGAALWKNHTYDSGCWQPATAAAVYRDLVIMPCNRGINALDSKTGEQRWQDSLEMNSIAIGGAHVYGVPLAGGTLWNLDAATGAVDNNPYLKTTSESAPAFANGVLYVGTDGMTICAFDARNGKLLWQAQTADKVLAPATVSNGMLYVGSGNVFTAYGLP